MKTKKEESAIKKRANQVKTACSMRKLLIQDGIKVTKSGRQFKALCPFHDEDTPSFNVYPDDARAKCFGCPWKGDIIDYVQKKRGLVFSEAVEYLEKHGPRRDDLQPDTKPEVEKDESYDPALFSKQVQQYTSNIINDETRAETIAKPRRWKPETITRLAEEGVLGWQDGKLIFIYEHGLKSRAWPDKKIFWESGSAKCPWRSAQLKSADEVYLTEGETDAISMIDAGFEDKSGVAVVACPSATTFNRGWAVLFEAKTVNLVFDDDKAGSAGTDEIVKVLEPLAKEIRVLDWAKVKKEIQG